MSNWSDPVSLYGALGSFNWSWRTIHLFPEHATYLLGTINLRAFPEVEFQFKKEGFADPFANFPMLLIQISYAFLESGLGPQQPE